jgi:hypothetical protein
MKKEEIKLDPVVILQIIKETPNDMELGKKIRKYYLNLLDKK